MSGNCFRSGRRAVRQRSVAGIRIIDEVRRHPRQCVDRPTVGRQIWKGTGNDEPFRGLMEREPLMAVETKGESSIQGDDRVGYELTLFYRLKMMCSAFWSSPVRLKLICLVVSLFAIVFATAYVQVLLNEWNAPFYDSLARRDLSEFFRQLGVFGIIAGSLLILNVVQAWFNQMTTLLMREGLARDLVDQWLKGKRGLKLSASGLIGVNPDQRLHEDTRNLAESTTGLAIGLVQSTILLTSFIGVLWELSAGFVFRYHGSTFSIPGYMFGRQSSTPPLLPFSVSSWDAGW